QVAGEEVAPELEEYRAAHGGALDLDGFNAFAVERRREIPTRQLAVEWGKAATLLLDRVSHASDQDWAGHRLPWLAGAIPLRYLVQSRVVEWWLHGEGSWHYGLAPGERPSSDKRPDAYIEGRGYRFALVAGRRAQAARYLEDGNLVVGGDEDLATTILEQIRAYPA